MKKFCWALLLFFLPVLSHAAITDEGVTREKTYVVHFTTTVAANTTSYFDLISLSTTASLFPHTLNSPGDIGELDISHVTMLLDKVATASATIKVGVATLVTPSTASVSYFFSRSSLNNVSNTDVVVTANFTPSFYRCKVLTAGTTTTSLIDGKTPFLVTNEKESGLFFSAFNSTSTLISPIGSVQPRAGDIVMKIQAFASAVSFIVDIWYHAER